MSSDDVSVMERRTFLCVVGAASAVVGLGAGCGTAAPAAPFSAGNVSDHAVGVWKMFAGSQAIVARDAGGFFAYSAICTHQQNTIHFARSSACAAPANCSSQSATGNTVCPVHSSTYDGNGAVTQGPAVAPLSHFQVTITAGVINVDPGVSVATTARVAAS